MKVNSFAAMEQAVLGSGALQRIVLAGAANADALESAVMAKRKGIASFLLVGDEAVIRTMLKDMGEHPDDYAFHHETDGAQIAQTAFKLLKGGRADLPMKGGVQTAEFMRGLLNREFGFVPPGALITQATVLEYTCENRMMVISDCAISIDPDVSAKISITRNAVALAKSIGIDTPKVAILAPLEKVNEKIRSTVEADAVKQAWLCGELKDCIVDGPLALDCVVDAEAARVKGLDSVVAGATDVLIMPDLAAGNIFTKALHYFARLPSSGVGCGATVPVIMTSRTDSAEGKYFSILTAVYCSLARRCL